MTDNYSRAILGWSLDIRNSGNNVVQALSESLQTIRRHHPSQPCALLVTDGGSENYAVTVEAYLHRHSPPDITKVVALRDISFSNSPAEAINKIIKWYIRHYAPMTLHHLEDCIRQAVHDYTFLRPHGSLNGLTPIEAYTGARPDMDFRIRISQAKAERTRQNRIASCDKC